LDHKSDTEKPDEETANEEPLWNARKNETGQIRDQTREDDTSRSGIPWYGGSRAGRNRRR